MLLGKLERMDDGVPAGPPAERKGRGMDHPRAPDRFLRDLLRGQFGVAGTVVREIGRADRLGDEDHRGAHGRVHHQVVGDDAHLIELGLAVSAKSVVADLRDEAALAAEPRDIPGDVAGRAALETAKRLRLAERRYSLLGDEVDQCLADGEQVDVAGWKVRFIVC